jgi:hypothetical protein
MHATLVENPQRNIFLGRTGFGEIVSKCINNENVDGI